YVFINVVEHVMTHFMAHHGLDLFRRTTPQKVVIHGDSHSLTETAYIGAHASSLLGSVDLIDISDRNCVGPRQAQDRLRYLRIVKAGNLIEYRLKIDRSYEDGEYEEQHSNDSSP